MLDEAAEAEAARYKQVRELQHDLADANWLAEEFHAERRAAQQQVRALQLRLLKLGAYEEAFRPAEQDEPLPGSTEVPSRFDRLRTLVFTGDAKVMTGLDDRSKPNWVNLCWEALLAVDDFGAASVDGSAKGDFRSWCQALGHRRIAVIGGPPGRLASRARVNGYRSALEEAGLRFDAGLVRYGGFSHEPAFRYALELLRLPEPPTAVFAGNDRQALSTYRAAAALGLRIPADLSVVGFDDLPFADWVTPRLTTVRTPLAEMAAPAAVMVLRLLAGEQPPTTRVEVAGELVVRDSSGPPRR